VARPFSSTVDTVPDGSGSRLVIGVASMPSWSELGGIALSPRDGIVFRLELRDAACLLHKPTSRKLAQSGRLWPILT
jgi:hypothetical protein